MQNKITVTIEGLSPLLMNRFPTESIHQTVRPTPEEQAERAAYRDPVSGELYLPAIALRQSMIEGAGNIDATYRDPMSGELYLPAISLYQTIIENRANLDVETPTNVRSAKELKDIVAGSLMISPECLLLGTQDYSIDSRSVVRSYKAGALIRHRPRLDKWRVSFTIQFDGITEDLMREIVDAAGSLVGVLDFRPSRKGPFGRFHVVEWHTEK